VFEFLKSLALRFAKVPPEPHPPAGSPGSIRVFRAAPNYWKYLLVMWGLRQMLGAFAIVVFLSMTATWQAAATRSVTDGKRIARFVPSAIHTLELIGLGFFLLQVPFSLALARLNYEMRWYIVTDRSLRVREGIFGVREMTLTYANVQNIAIQQGPLQRLLGISDVAVRTAGGGGSTDAHGNQGHGPGASMHTGILRAVDNAEQVRDLILDQLRRLRDAGLGDPDDRHHPAHHPKPGDSAESLRAAARDLLDAAHALRK
jgi:membrane protein YdbS with pleckstrin-like domain